MASAEGESEDRPEASDQARECMACRGSGRVISNLGGTPSEVSCPWCGGSGMRVPGIDAQEHWREDAPAAEAAQDPASSGAAAADTAE